MMEKLTEDGGIVKVILEPASESSTLPKWERGTNAFLHYTASIAPFRRLETEPSKMKACCTKHDHPHVSPTDAPKEVHASKELFISPKGMKFQFDPTARKLLVDSKERDGPESYFEMRIGMSFVFKAFEQAVKSMKVGEKSRFLIAPEYTEGFIQIESLLRREKKKMDLASKGHIPAPSCCGSMNSGEFEDLYETENMPLELEIELYRVLMPDQFKREVWEMTLDEKLAEWPVVKSKGESLIKAKDYVEARSQYRRCLVLLENLKLMQPHAETAPHTEALLSKETIQQHLLACKLNDTLCSLKLMDYPHVITQSTDILKEHPLHPKALYRRALAYIRIGRDLEDAERDLKMLLETKIMRKEDPDFSKAWSELKQRWAHVKEKEKKIYKNILSAY